MEVMGTMQRDVLGRLSAEEKERNPQLGSILLRCSAAYPFHAGVVRDVLAMLQHFAAFNLPAHARVFYVVEAIPIQGVREGWTSLKRQMERCCQPSTAVRDKEVDECPGWIVEAHHIGSVLSGDIEFVVGTKRYSDWDVEVAAGVGEEIYECAGRGVVSSDAKIPAESAPRNAEVAVRSERYCPWRKQTARAERVTSRHEQSERRLGREIERLDSGGIVVENVQAVVRGVDLHIPRARVNERGYKVARVRARGGVEALNALRWIRVSHVQDAFMEGHARWTCQVG